MNKTFALVRYFFLVIVTLLVTITFSNATPSLAAQGTPIDSMKRADMQAIAERYLRYTWTPNKNNVVDNVKHSGEVDTPDTGYILPNPAYAENETPPLGVGVPPRRDIDR